MHANTNQYYGMQQRTVVYCSTVFYRKLVFFSLCVCPVSLLLRYQQRAKALCNMINSNAARATTTMPSVLHVQYIAFN
jgi:hypothetical protein